MQVRGVFPALYDNVEKEFKAILRDTLKELPAKSKKLFSEEKSDKKFERRATITPFGDVPEKPEGDIYAMDIIQPGWSTDFTHIEFGMGFEHTQTAKEDDQYGVLAKATEWLAYSMRYVAEKYAARVLNNGFTTSQAAPDGKAFFATDHILKGGGTAANTLAAAADLSWTSLRDAITLAQTDTKLESGQILDMIDDWYLVVHPSEEMNADMIVNSTGRPDTAENARNPIKARRNIEVLVWPLLTDLDSWFLVPKNKKMHGMLTFNRVPFSNVPSDVDPYTGNQILKARFRRSWGVEMWQGVIGVAGA
jgi:hypothetical protein